MSKTSVELADGHILPLVGLGTFQSTNAQTITDLIRASLDAGYRHIDTAYLYGNHNVIGDALAKIFSEGKYKREDIFITTKVFPNKELNALDILQKSLKDLQLTYVDLYLLHWPVTAYGQPPSKINHKPQHIAWYELEECHKAKLTRSIGVSNYNVQSLSNILSLCSIPPVVNQIELHVYLQQPDLIKFCEAFKVAVTAYSPLARGGADVAVQLGHKIDLFNEPVLVEIAKKHQKTVAQIALHFLVRQGISVIPKTEKPERLPQNIDVFNINLSEEEVAQIKKLDQNLRTVSTTHFASWGNYNVFA